MALVTLNLKPSEKQLKNFGLVGLIMCNVIGIVLFGLEKISNSGYLIFIVVGILLFVLSRVSTRLLKPVFLVLVLLTFPIGWVFSHLAMALFYYGIITPVALLFRLLNRDPLCRRREPDTDTYWLRYKQKRSARDYFRQF